MLIFVFSYVLVIVGYIVVFQRRESEHVRQVLVEHFVELSEAEPKNPDVQEGGVVYVMKNMGSPLGQQARREFRKQQLSELIIIGLFLVFAPIAAIIAMMTGHL